ATAARETRDYFVAKDVIPRPSLDLDQIIYSEETQGLDQEVDKEEKLPLEAGPEEEKDRSVEKEENLEEEVLEEKVLEEVPGGLGGESDQAQEASQESLEGLEDREPTCNLCLDPACPRKKGEPRVDCIHFEEDDWRK
ncbi:MAG: hypothetical protein Q4E37_07095, partial [Tissierellia bacterium]|nr:hypothetical protein [Tissierellia bacterium]